MITTEWNYPMLLLGSFECCLARLSNSFLDYRYSITSLQLYRRCKQQKSMHREVKDSRHQKSIKVQKDIIENNILLFYKKSQINEITYNNFLSQFSI